jgi:hypothetical protein
MAFQRESQLQRIEESAFAGSGLRRIVLPQSLEFVAVSAILEIHVYYAAIEPGEALYTISGSFLHNTLDKTLVRYFGSQQKIIIPTFLEIIGGSCFEIIEAPEEISFPEKSNVKYIGTKPFAYSSLESLMTQKSVKRIDGSAFLCTKPSSVAVESGSERLWVGHDLVQDIIDARLAMYFGTFRKVVILGLIEIIDRMVFSMCKTIEEIAFEPGSRLKQIGQSAFSESSLKRIFIPKSVEVIGVTCFCRCRSLRDVKIESPSGLLLIEDRAFADTQISHLTIERLADSPPFASRRPGCHLTIRAIQVA